MTDDSNPVTKQLPLDSDEEHPRQLLKFPVTDDIICYGGDDGRIVQLSPSNEPIVARHWEDDVVRAVAVSHDGKRVAVASDVGNTEIYVFPTSSDGTDASSSRQPHAFLHSRSNAPCDFCAPPATAPIRQLLFVPNSYYLLIASEAGLFLCDATDETSVQSRYMEHDTATAHQHSGMRGVALTTIKQKTILVSLSMDGHLSFWDMTDPKHWKLILREASACIVKKDLGEILGADAYDRSCFPLFWKQFVIIPGEHFLQMRRISVSAEATTQHGEIQVHSCPDQHPEKDEQGNILVHMDGIVSIQVSPVSQDTHFCTSGRDGRVICWKLEKDSKNDVKATFVKNIYQFLDNAPTHLLWDKDQGGGETLRIVTATAKVTTIKGREAIAPAPVKWSTVDNSHVLADAEQSRRLKKMQQDKEKSDDEQDDNEDFGFAENGKHQKNTFIDDEAAEDDDDDDDDSFVSSSSQNGKIVQTDNVERADYDDESSKDEFPMDDDAHIVHGHKYNLSRATLALPEPQAAFAPSSTPLDEPRRFMCWNHIGSITLHRNKQDIGRSTVDVHFTDSAFRRPISFTDNMGFILGSIGDDGAIFATDVDDNDESDVENNDDDDLGIIGKVLSETTKASVKKSNRSTKKGTAGSSIYFHRFETFASVRDKDWYLTLPDGERALGCACGEGWAAVITSRRFLRTFTSGGNQGPLFWLSGAPVTMVGRSRFLAVFYHTATPLLDGTQKLGYMLVDVPTQRVVVQGDASCISSKGSLYWVGFTNDCSLVAMDSDGMVSMLVRSSATADDEACWQWMPVLDTLGLRKSIEDSYWPITVHDGKLICVPLKGGIKHPDATRRPVTTALNLRLPLARSGHAQTNALEELAIRANIALEQKKVMHDLTVEGDEDEEFEKEYIALSAQVDKVTLKMFAATVEAGKLERALDLIERLHLEKSFDLAMRIAEKSRKLVDLIEDAKDRKFGGSDEVDVETPPHSNETGSSSRSRITPESSHMRVAKRTFHDEAETEPPRFKRKSVFE